MYPKNASSPPPIPIGAVVQISDGAVQTSGCTVSIRTSDDAETSGAGSVAYSTGGVVLYTPTQGETNHTWFFVTAYKTGCIPVGVLVVPTAAATPGTVQLQNSAGNAGINAPANFEDLAITDTTGIAKADVTTWLTTAPLALSSQQVQAVVPTTQKVDVETIKTQAITCSAGVTILASVGTAGTAIAQTGDSYAIVNGDHGLVSIQDDMDTVLTRLVGTILAGNHTAQTGDSYAIVNGDHGLVSIQDDIDTVLTNLATVAGYVDTEIATLIGYGAPPSAVTIANQVVASLGTGSTLTWLAPASTALSTATWTNTKAGYIDAAISSVSGLNAAGVRAAIGMASADLDTQLDTILAAASPSGGAYAQTVTVTSGGVAVPNATVYIYSGTTLVDYKTTNSSGVAAPTCGAGSYSLVVLCDNYESSTTAITVTAAAARAVSLTAITVTASEAGKTTLYGTVYDELGAKESGVTMTCRMISVPSGTGLILDTATRTTTSSVAGLVQFANCIQGATYRVTRGSASVNVVVGTAATQEITNLCGTP